MAMTRLSDPTPRMTLPRALLSEALRLARSPLAVVHLVCGLAAGLACGEYFSVTRWDPALGADAYAQFLGALMPLMSAIVCGLAVDEERVAGRLANLTAVPSRGRAVAAKLLALAALGAGAGASSQTTPPAPRATEAATTGSASTPPPRPRAPTGAPSRSPTAPRAARWPPSRSPCEGLTTQALTPACLAIKRFPDNNARCRDRPV